MKRRITHLLIKTAIAFGFGYGITVLYQDAKIGLLTMIFLYVFDLSFRQDIKDMKL